MQTSADEIAVLLHAHGQVLRRADHPRLAATLDRLLRDRRLVAPLPGVYAPPDWRDDLETQLRVLTTWRPSVVVTGAAAARLTFWPGHAVDQVSAAAPGLRSRPGFALRNRRIDPDLVTEVSGIRCTVPALTALDLTTATDGSAIDAVLRSRRATLAELHRVLDATPERPGNQARRRLLEDSRDEPWSEAERLAHQLLRAAGITGWTTNHPVEVRGHTYFLDIAFAGVKLAIEIDGREFHEGKTAFEYDRARQNDLMLGHWRVLRFTWTSLTTHPEAFVLAVLEALAEY